MDKRQAFTKYRIFHLAVVILLGAIVFLYIHNLAGWLVNDDEGSYFYEFWRMNRGDVPYRDFLVPEAPMSLFTGYAIFNLFGPNVFLARLITVITAFLTAYLVFLIGRRVFGYSTGLFGALSYLILPVVYLQARFYRSETYMVFFSTLGLLMFIKAWQEDKKAFFLYSGIFFGISFWYKLLGALSVAALLAFIAHQLIFKRKAAVILRGVLLPFLSGLALAAISLYAVFNSISPSFLECVVGYHMRQPAVSAANQLTTIMENMKSFFMVSPIQYGCKDKHSWLIIFSFLPALLYLFTKDDDKKIFSYYIFTVPGVILSNPYGTETTRYLLYLVPVATLVFANFTLGLLRPERGVLVKACGWAVLAFVASVVLVPGIIRDAEICKAKEEGTLSLAGYVRDWTGDNDYLMADYGDVTFYAKRKTTPLMAGMNKAAVDDKGITSDKLIKEIEEYPVEMILIHREGGIPERTGYYLGTPGLPHHFSTLIESEDGPKFMGYLKEHYHLKGEFNRVGQIFDVYIKK